MANNPHKSYGAWKMRRATERAALMDAQARLIGRIAHDEAYVSLATTRSRAEALRVQRLATLATLRVLGGGGA